MRTRSYAAVIGVVAALQVAFIVPKVSNAQLADLAASTAVRGNLNKMASSNALGARDRAKKTLDKAAKANETSYPGTQPAVDFGGFKAPSYEPGKVYTESGQVLGVVETPAGKIVLVLQGMDGKNAHVTGFVQPEGMMFQSGQSVTFTGVYVGTKVVGKEKVAAHAFDQVTFGEPPSAKTAQEAKPEPKDFAAPLGGWKLVGTANSGKNGTAVFVKEGAVRYAEPGESFKDGMKLVSVSEGRVDVVFESKRLSLSPW